MPWHNASEDGKIYKYQYHPHGDKNQPLRAAPSAMNTVIVPNVTLPEVRILPALALSGPLYAEKTIRLGQIWRNGAHLWQY